MARFDRTRAKTERARELRRDMTGVEKMLWARLTNAQLGVSFRRQHPIGPYFVDFYCAPASLAVELDGDQHGFVAGIASDARRTAFLADKGLRVLRFWNNEVVTNIDGVVETIWLAVQPFVAASTPTPTLPLAGGGREPVE
ncbi:MAG: endonuclease domain-containing protein [Methylocystis sp.]|uniref:endonuclease domain-containing protein n=1 Tax=Methylocystis sp. TaxID=1911079 RepID=UPI003DA6A3E0